MGYGKKFRSTPPHGRRHTPSSAFKGLVKFVIPREPRQKSLRLAPLRSAPSAKTCFPACFVTSASPAAVSCWLLVRGECRLPQITSGPSRSGVGFAPICSTRRLPSAPSL